MKNIIAKVLTQSRNRCECKKAFLPSGWTIVNIENISLDIAGAIKKEGIMQGARRNGKPRSEAERKARHESLYGKGSKLPARGSGRKKK